ncbi:MAG: hypothetical protein ACFE8E_13035 [Candidatus Hodarchaeota archaeon]
MKKKSLLTGITIWFIFILLVNSNSVLGSDDDDDYVDDDFERLNLRDIDITLSSNEIEIQSLLRQGLKVDEIEIRVRYNNEGISFEVSYESEYISESEAEFEIEFRIIIRKLIEFVDLNDNGIFDPSIDDNIQELNLDSFDPAQYQEEIITTQTSLHHFIINSSDSIFSMHLYIPEEFALKDNVLMIPTKPKIDINIQNFPFLNVSSNLALYISLESETSYSEYDDTEDEELGYAFNEKAVSTLNDTFTGIFSWNQSLLVDGIVRSVNASTIEIDDYDNEYQKMYLIYPQGVNISHDPKIGLEGIFIFNLEQFPWYLLTVFLTIGAVSISIVVPVYFFYYNKRNRSPRNGHAKIPKMKNGEITAFSEDFYAFLDQFEWDTNEKEEFIKEMSSLKPAERKRILNEMLDKYKSDQGY